MNDEVSYCDIFDLLALIGGLCLFLFGMSMMGEALERRAGEAVLEKTLAKLTKNKLAGFLTGLGVTAIIQSSSATTVMVVGFVNSGIMTLRQSISVIMGANIGTTATAWVLSLGGISSDNVFVVQLLKPSSFTPVLALIGTCLMMFGKTSKKKDTGTILLGFATLMFGMDAMADSVSGLAELPQFQRLFVAFKNPFLGVIVGAVLTAVDTVQLGIGRYTSGAVLDRAGFIRSGGSDYHGSEHRHLHNRHSFLLGNKQKRQARSRCSPYIQRSWCGHLAQRFQRDFICIQARNSRRFRFIPRRGDSSHDIQRSLHRNYASDVFAA